MQCTRDYPSWLIHTFWKALKVPTSKTITKTQQAVFLFNKTGGFLNQRHRRCCLTTGFMARGPRGPCCPSAGCRWRWAIGSKDVKDQRVWGWFGVFLGVIGWFIGAVYWLVYWLVYWCFLVFLWLFFRVAYFFFLGWGVEVVCFLEAKNKTRRS